LVITLDVLPVVPRAEPAPIPVKPRPISACRAMKPSELGCFNHNIPPPTKAQGRQSLGNPNPRDCCPWAFDLKCTVSCRNLK